MVGPGGSVTLKKKVHRWRKSCFEVHNLQQCNLDLSREQVRSIQVRWCNRTVTVQPCALWEEVYDSWHSVFTLMKVKMVELSPVGVLRMKPRPIQVTQWKKPVNSWEEKFTSLFVDTTQKNSVRCLHTWAHTEELTKLKWTPSSAAHIEKQDANLLTRMGAWISVNPHINTLVSSHIHTYLALVSCYEVAHSYHFNLFKLRRESKFSFIT